MLCYCVIKAFPDLFTLRGRNRIRLPLPSLTLNRGPFTGDWVFPYNRTFPCYKFEKRCPQPCFCLNKGLSGLLRDQENGWRPGIEFLVAHPQQEHVVVIPRVTNACSNSHFLLFSLQLSFWLSLGWERKKSCEEGASCGHHRTHETVFISWSVSCNTPSGAHWFSRLIPVGLGRKIQHSLLRDLKDILAVQIHWIPQKHCLF